MRGAASDFDVIVVGGGPSGIMAAVAAGRLGARTLMVERHGFPGGMATAAMTGPISPFHFRDNQVVKGLPQEFVTRMVTVGGATGHLKVRNPFGTGSYVCIYDRETYKYVALSMLEEAGVHQLYHSFFLTPIISEGTVTAITVANKSGIQTYRTKVVVDATGDGDVAARAGAPFVFGHARTHSVQPGTLMFEMADCDTNKVLEFIISHPEEFEWWSDIIVDKPLPLPAHWQHEHFVAQGWKSLVQQGIQTGELYLGRDTLLVFTTVHPGLLHFNSTRIHGLDGTSAESFSHAEIEGRKQAWSLAQFLVRRVPGFEKAYLAATAVQVGVRESRHIEGLYVLSGEDVISGRKFEDVVVRGYFPIDIHAPEGGAGYGIREGGKWLDLEDSYDIPYRCLVPRNVGGLIVTGRAISATFEAHGSLRTQGSVMALGQAAGTAAAIAARANCQPAEIDVRLLQRMLVRSGAELRGLGTV